MENYSSENIAWWNHSLISIEKIIIEDGVTTIGDYSFNNCRLLTEIKIPEGVTSIGKEAFRACGLQAIDTWRRSFLRLRLAGDKNSEFGHDHRQRSFRLLH